MEFEFEFAGPTEDVFVRLSGEADAAGAARFNEALMADPHFRAGLLFLIDLRALSFSRDAASLQSVLAGVIERDWLYPPAGVALVVDGGTAGIAQLARAHMGGTDSRREIFTSVEDARAWLDGRRADG